MLHWNDLHPYNAVNVVRIPAALDRARLTRVINGTLEAQGLTHLALNRRRGTFRYHGGPADCEIKIIDQGANRERALAEEIGRQLNTGFSTEGHFDPFRFFVVPGAEGFSLGIVYFHVIADAEAMVLLIRELVEAYAAGKKSKAAKPLELYPKCRDGIFAHPRALARKLAALPGFLRDMRSSGRRFCNDARDFNNRCTCFTLETGQLAALIRTAKAWAISR